VDEVDSVTLTLPFDGIWGVIQGFQSGGTHAGYAAFALDLAPPQRVPIDRRRGRVRLQDFSCYGQPILAAADGVVVRVEKGFPDSPPFVAGPGGNFVIIQHAPRQYTEMVHLQAGSITVAVGDHVVRGQPLARCGNSGNATVPHLHIGFLSSIDPITTARMRLHHYEVLEEDGTWMRGDGEPRQGQWIRRISAVSSSAR
jgi:murein DD-endopeptidase MepM/ murein hydrolase activator NlpD